MEKITVQTNVNADIQKVWNYYTDPEHITQWHFALDSWHCPKVQIDLRVGGKFIARMESKDASEGFYFAGTYIDVVFGKNLYFEMHDGRSVSVEFKNHGENNIDVVVTFDAENENPLEVQREGWQNILNNFKNHVESN